MTCFPWSRVLPAALPLSLVFASAALAQDAGQQAEWTPIFNGRNLDGWTAKIRGYEPGDNFADTFRVRDGLLVVDYDGYEGEFGNRFGHLFWHEKLGNYDLLVEYRFVGEQVPGGPGWAFRNSGIMLHGQDPASMPAAQDFPVSIEMQLLGGDGTRDRTNANLCTPGTHVEMDGQLVKRHCTGSTSDTFHGDRWVTVIIEVRGNQVIRHRIGDDVVLEYQRPQLDPDDASARPLIEDGQLQLHEGTISLQSESHPIEFRRVELRKVDSP